MQQIEQYGDLIFFIRGGVIMRTKVFLFAVVLMLLTGCSKNVTDSENKNDTKGADYTESENVTESSDADETFWPDFIKHGYADTFFPDFEIGENEEGGKKYGILYGKDGLKIVIGDYINGDNADGSDARGREISIFYNGQQLDVIFEANWFDYIRSGPSDAVFLADVTGDGTDELVFNSYGWTAGFHTAEMMVVDLDAMETVNISDTIFNDIAEKYSLLPVSNNNGTVLADFCIGSEIEQRLEFNITDKEADIKNLYGIVNSNVNYIYEKDGSIYVLMQMAVTTERQALCSGGPYIITKLEYIADTHQFIPSDEHYIEYDINIYTVGVRNMELYEKAAEEYKEYQESIS